MKISAIAIVASAAMLGVVPGGGSIALGSTKNPKPSAKLLIVNPVTGAVLWRQQIGTAKRIVVMDPRNGKILWTQPGLLLPGANTLGRGVVPFRPRNLASWRCR